MIKLRVGDMVRFRRGSSEYVGRISRLFRGDMAEVDGKWGAWVIRPSKSVVALETPVLSRAEEAIVRALVGYSDGVSARRLREEGRWTSGRVLAELARRGLVQGLRDGVVSDGGPLRWRLTDAGRVAADHLP